MRLDTNCREGCFGASERSGIFIYNAKLNHFFGAFILILFFNGLLKINNNTYWVFSCAEGFGSVPLLNFGRMFNFAGFDTEKLLSGVFVRKYSTRNG